MKLNKYFWSEELVPPTIGTNPRLDDRWYIDSKMFAVLTKLRERMGKQLWVNTWFFLKGGKATNDIPYFHESAFRLPDTKTGARFSQHKLARAFDVRSPDLEEREIYDELATNQKLYMELGLTTLEDFESTRTWVHMDSRWTGLDRLLIVKP
jgi:hypothetical protein